MLPVHDLEVPPTERRFHRASGRLCLDLVATVGERWRRRFERLRTPQDLDRWLAGAALAPASEATAADLADVRHLRGAVELLAVAALGGDPYPGQALEVVNAAAARPAASRRLEGREVRPVVPDVAAAASTVARDAIDLFGGPLATRVRECAADDCALVFLDRSRAANRRWCSMRGCGNRSKVARHRARTSP